MSEYVPFPPDYPLRQELVEYCQDVLSGKVIACQKHKWACERFLRDLEREGTEAFPFVFDERKALRFLSWMRLFKHRKGVLVGERIEPHIIQRFVFGNIYGWYHKTTGYRRFRKAYWQVGRKNAKSQSLACVGSYELMAFGAGASEVYCAATKTEQARIVWTETEKMLRACKELDGSFKVAYGKIEHLKTGSLMVALSKEDQKKGDGYNPQCAIVDEYHAHDTSEIYDIMVSGMGARPQPLLMVITTAGYELNNPCYRVEYHYVAQILDPANPIENDEYFVMINELDKDAEGELIDDIKDESAWAKANPILASYDEGISYLRGELRAALDVPEKMRTFLTKNMDVWVDQREAGYMQLDKWKACKKDMPDLTGRMVYVGVDLSAKIDLTSVGFEIPLSDGCFAVLSHSFMPEDTLRAKMQTDKVPYDQWVKQGYITVTPGAVVDYQFVKQYIKDQVARYKWEVQEICFDPWNATQFATDMQDEGYTCVEIVQGRKTMAEPTPNFREMVYQGKIIHDGNPVLTWAIGNAITRMDHNQNIMLDKAKSRQRIDPVAALMNAHVRAMVGEEAVNVSEFTEASFLDRLWG
jgi:phage terminase large subunit-like protein